MKTLEKIQNVFSVAGASMAMLLKTAIMSRRPSKSTGRRRGSILILGNGPSLKEAMESEEGRKALEKYPLMSVNFALNSPELRALKPEYYIMADGGLFADSANANINELWKRLAEVDWPMTLWVPTAQRGNKLLKSLPGNVTVKYFNLTPGGGAVGLRRFLYRRGLAMPRPRNVLVPAMMAAMSEGFTRIGLAGADHSWSRTLWVNDRNRVVTVQPHFYEDNEEERERVESVYKDIRLHQIYESFSIAFRSYFDVAGYAASRGVEIINVTPGSFIDAFPRLPLERF